MVPIKTLKDYIDEIQKNCDEIPNIYRGQYNVSWDITSSLFRRNSNNKGISVERLLHAQQNIMNTINQINDPATVALKDIPLLTHLQHIGVDTCLIDFSKSPLIALFFACFKGEGNEDSCNAAVYIYKTVSLMQTTILVKNESLNDVFNDLITYEVIPANINRRILAQQSLFLLPIKGYIEKEYCKVIEIDGQFKQNILSELSQLGYTAETLFPDLEGYAKYLNSENPNPNHYLYSLIYSGGKYYRNFQSEKAIEIYNQAQEILKDNSSLFGSRFQALLALINDRLSDVYYSMSDYKKAYDFAKVSTEKINTMPNSPELIAYCYYKEACCCQEIGLNETSLDQTEKYYKKALKKYKLAEETISSSTQDYTLKLKIRLEIANVKTNYANCLLKKSKCNISVPKEIKKLHEEATTYYKKAIKECSLLFGDNHADTANVYNRYGNLLRTKYKITDNSEFFKDALRYYTMALDIRKKMYINGSPATASSYKNIGNLYHIAYTKNNKSSLKMQALQYYNIAKDIYSNTVGELHSDAIYVSQKLALLITSQ